MQDNQLSQEEISQLTEADWKEAFGVLMNIT